MLPSVRVLRAAGIAAVLVVSAVGGGPTFAATTTPAAGGAAGSPDAPADCPTTLAESAIVQGMTGTGWTVTTGDTPRPFRVKVLGTLADGIGPGRDLIVIKVSDLPGEQVISRANGIWAGMSGSPVYIGGRLAGAVSYGFSTGPSRIGGMTPARQMQQIASYAPASSGRSTVPLSSSVARVVAAETGRTSADLPSLHRLAVPVVVTGVAGPVRRQLTSQLRREFGTVKTLTSGVRSATASTSLTSEPVAGGNLAGVIASGDITVAAVGTTTSVCGDTVIGFGHPMTGAGRVALGAARASAVTIVDDPAGTPFKMANIGQLFGKLDQDRIVGIRATAGHAPRAIPVVATVRSLETGVTRTGRTTVYDSDWLPVVAANHLLEDIVSATNAEGPGTSTLTWDIQGTRPNGQHWTLARTDRMASTSDIGLDSAQLLLDQLSTLTDASREPIKFDSVAISASVSPHIKVYTVRSVKVSRNGGAFKSRASITARTGDVLRFQVTLRDRRGVTSTRVVPVTIPANASGSGVAVVGNDGSGDACAFDPSACPSSFPKLLASIQDAPRNDDLLVSLRIDRFDGSSRTVTRSQRLDKVVQGSIQIPIDIR